MWCDLVVAGGVTEALAEASREGRLSAGFVKMRGVAYGDSAEVGYALSTLLGVEGADRGGGCHNVLPDRIRRASHKVGEQHTGQAVVAKQGYCIVVFACHTVIFSLAEISVFCEHLVKAGADVFVCFLDACPLYQWVFGPLGGAI